MLVAGVLVTMVFLLVSPLVGLGAFLVACAVLYPRQPVARASVRVQVTTRRPGRPSIPASVRHAVWVRDGGRCVECGTRQQLEFDHIIPFSRGGATTVNNLELRCRYHNRHKGAVI